MASPRRGLAAAVERIGARRAVLVEDTRMVMILETRASDSPFVQHIWRARSEHAGGFISLAANHWEIVVTRPEGAPRTLCVRGPETRATLLTYPEGVEWCGIRFRLGSFTPLLPAGALVDRTVNLPAAGSRTFWLKGAAWPYPDFEQADAFVDRLVRDGLLVLDPVVAAAMLEEHWPGLSARTLQRRFKRATGLTLGTVRQIVRARRAMDLLQHGGSILDVVHETGYYDQPHLTRSLRRWLGQTPAQIVGALASNAPSL